MDTKICFQNFDQLIAAWHRVNVDTGRKHVITKVRVLGDGLGYEASLEVPGHSQTQTHHVHVHSTNIKPYTGKRGDGWEG
jgi:hypothetical protein